MNTQPSCGCGGGAPSQDRSGVILFRRASPFQRRDACCPECANGLVVYPAGAGVLVRAPGESEADFQRRLQAQADAERPPSQAEQQAAREQAAREQAARSAADRDAVLRGLGGVLGTANTGLSEGFATERARLEAEARTAQARAEAQAATERARIEAARDIELARMRAGTPNVSLAPLETATTPAQQQAAVTLRTDSGGGSFPVVPVLAVGGGLAFLAWALNKKGRR